jgi:dephospho-CoA kinase
MLRVGLTGGYASGKSTVGRYLEELGCHLIRADDLGHQVLAPGGEAYGAVIEAFGSVILKEDGSIDRRVLGSIVFSDPEKLALLNRLVHPHVFARQERLMEEWEARDPSGIVVVEAAIMMETGSHKRYGKLIVVHCPEEEQIRRGVDRDHTTAEQARDRLRNQMPLAAKLREADFTIDTSGSPEHTREQTRHVFLTLQSMERRSHEATI